MGSKSPQTSTVVNTPPPQVLAQYQNVVGQANQVAQTPYQAYGGPLVSPIDVQQGMGITGVNAYSNQAQPQLQEANRLTQQGSTAVNPTAFSGSQVGQYMSPYQSQVINATEAELANQDAQQQQQLQGNAIGAGAFGGDRAGVAQGILAGQQSLANNSTIANLNNQNYTQGLGEFNTQQSTNLAAQQANQARLQSAGAQIGNIGTASQTAGLQGAAAQVQAGTLEQQTQQAQDTAAYNQFLQQQAYPFQTTQWLANISEGIGSNSGGTSTTTQPGPNPLNSIIGGGLGLLGLFSDKRLKENISPVGKTFDGQTIYRYNFKGSPRTEVGLIAQEVEKKHPEAVGRVGGLRMVDYGQATEDSAKRKHFASGGDVIPYADNAINELTWIPQTQAMMGPGPPKSGAPINNGQGQMDQSISQGFKQLGSGLQNSSIGDSISDFMQDSFGLARGGIVPRRGYDIGGTPFQGIVTPVMMGASGTTGVGGAVNGSNAKGDNDADDKPQPITPIIHGGGDGPGAPAGSSGGDGGGMMRGGLVMRRRRPHFDDGGDVLDPTPSPVQMPGTVSDADLALAAAVQMPGMVSDNDLALAAARANATASEWTSSPPPAWSPGGSTPAQTSPRDTSELGASIQDKLLESAVNGSQGGMTLPAAAQGVSQGIANGMYLPGNGPDGGILPPAAQSGGSSMMGPQPLHPINDGTMGGEQAASRGLFGPAPVWARATGNADGSPPPPVAGDPAADAAQWNEAQAAARARAAASGKPFYQGSGEHDYTGAADAGPVQPINNGTPSSAGDTQADAVWLRMLRQESGGQQFNADGSVKTSPKGAIGIAQIMPSTGPEAAKLAGLAWDPVKFANDPAYNVALGHALYNKQLQDFGTPALAAAAYNAGPTALAAAQTKAATKGGSWLSYLPSETQNYVAAVTGGSPASAAIDKAAGAPQGGLTTGAPQGGLLPSDGSAMTAPTGVANAAKTLGSTVSNGSLLPLGLSDAARSALMSAGFGMMASKSRNLGQAIGEGGLQGIGTYRDMAKLGQEAGLNQAQIANLQSEAAYRMAKLGQEAGLNQAQIANLQSEAAYRPASLTLESQKLQLQIAAVQRQLKAGDILGGIDTGTSSGPISVSPAPTPINGANAPIPIPSRASGANPPPVVASTGNPASLGVGTTGNAPVSSSAPSGANTLPPANSDFWQGVPALENPAILNDRAARVAALNPELAGQLMTKAQAIVNRGTVLKNGQLVPIPGYAETQAAVEGAKAGASEAAKAPYEMVEVQPEAGGATQLVPKSSLLGGNGPKGTVVGPGAGSPPGSAIDSAADANPIIKSQPAFYAERQKQIATDEGTMMEQFQSRQLSKQRLQTLAGIMQSYQPGAWAEQKGNLIANLRAAGFNVPSTATANPAAFQEFIKNATANVFNDVKGMGGRVLVSEIQGLTKANANPELQPEAAAAIIGQGLGVINYEDQHTQDYFNWKKQNPNATQTADFELPWAQSHPVSQYVAQANKGIAYQGQSIPPATQRTSGQTYMTPKGPMVWRGTGWASP